jgi:hypothetical protein
MKSTLTDSGLLLWLALLCCWCGMSRGRVLNLRESNASVTISPAPRVRALLQSSDAFSVELWMRAEGPVLQSGVLLRLFGSEADRDDSATTWHDPHFLLRVVGTRFEASVRVTRTTGPATVAVASADGTCIASQWLHVAVAFDSPNGVLRLVVGNGSDVAEVPLTDSARLKRGVHSVAVGGALRRTDADGETPSIDGDVDEVRLWSTARSLADVQRTYRQHFVDTTLDVERDGLLMYLTANGGVSIDTSDRADAVEPAKVLLNGATVRAGVDAPVALRGDAQPAAPTAPEAAATLAPERIEYHQRLSSSIDQVHSGRKLGNLGDMPYKIDASGHAKEIACDRSFSVKWHAKVPGPLLGNALLVDMTGDGQRELAIGTQASFVELLHTAELGELDPSVHGGSTVAGWPATLAGAEFVASPRAIDMNGDGVPELMLATHDGEIVFFSHDGAPMLGHTIKLMPARVPRHWYAHGGARDNELSFSLYQHGLASQGAADRATNALFFAQAGRATLENVHDNGGMSVDEAMRILALNAQWVHETMSGDDDDDYDDDGEDNEDDDTNVDDVAFGDDAALGKMVRRASTLATRRKTELRGPDDVNITYIRSVFGGMMGGLTDEGIASMSLFLPSENAGGARVSARLRRGHDALRAPLYEEWEKRTRDSRRDDADHVFVDAHILADVVVRDLNDDGRTELIVPVSYFFGRDYSDDPQVRARLPSDVTPSKYVASGIAVHDLECGALLWRVEFDMTTQVTPYAAFLTAKPVVVDLDGDGALDIVVATGAGYVYAINSRTRALFPNYPVTLASMHVSPIVADVDDDGRVDVLALDALGGVTRFDALTTKVAWTAQTSGAPNAKPILADVDGDGWLDLVFAAGDELLWALSVRSGEPVGNFPVLVGGKLLGDIVALPLNGAGSVVLAVATDGFMYAVDSQNVCVDVVDVGAGALAAPLADDLDDDGLLDLVVPLHNGDIYCFATDLPVHPLGVVHAPGDEWTQRRRQRGIFFADKQHESFDGALHLSGAHHEVAFFILHGPHHTHNQTVTVRLTLSPGGPLLAQAVVHTPVPTALRLAFESPEHVMHTATLTLTMVDSVGHEYVDTMAVSMNQHSYRLLKWLHFAPFGASIVAVLLAVRFATIERHLPLRL